jgi:thiamine biosynthesis lipoprotein
MHHIIDPHTGRPAEPVWRTVTVATTSCVMANTLTTAAIVRGAAAKIWLGGQGVPARLVAQDGALSGLGGWPASANV